MVMAFLLYWAASEAVLLWVYFRDVRNGIYADFPAYKIVLGGCIVVALAPVLLPGIGAASLLIMEPWND